MIDLFVEYFAACHEMQLLKHFIRLIVRSPESVSVCDLPQLSWGKIAALFDVNGSADLVHAHVASWIMREARFFVFEYERLNYIKSVKLGFKLTVTMVSISCSFL